MNLQTITNSTKEDLLFTYDSTNYILKAGESKQMPDYLAQHAAKKLADREYNKKVKNTWSVEEHRKLMEKYTGEIVPLSTPEVVQVAEDTQSVAQVINS